MAAPESSRFLEWVRVDSGGWWLFDKPRGTPRHPIATISGFARIGYHATIHARGFESQFRGKSIPKLKKQVVESV